MKKITILFLLTLSLFGSQKAISQEAYIGEIRMFAGNFAPVGWALCDGQLLSIAQNTALFSLLGTTYGGNGTTTFALPDLRGRVPMHPGSGPGLSPRVQGEAGGSENNTLTIAQMPAHNHTVNASTADGDQNVPTNTVPGNTKALDKEYVSSAPNTTMSPSMIGMTGQGQPVNNMQPYGTVNFIIALNGIYPSRP
ncbi:MAG TPA: tail fiber protein [Flavobacterium sp.]|uniref:phage tail protein n=1 Tax=Flavobacterium sp. TaxID=239 RepID=UPI002D1C602C|nr:tail fiber protein [Flavobacterium sp.]HSD14287.1 tail fiber protein [Flavobacterium sp.]